MLKKTLVAVALSSAALCAMADESDARREARQAIDLQDGGTLYVFKGGKMAYENRYGAAVSVKAGTVLTARDGTRITMVGNEVMQLAGLLREGLED